MIYEFAAMEHETVLRELRQVFDETTTEVLGRVLGRMTARMQEIQVTRDEFRELRATVTVLVEAQARTEAKVHELAEAQRRTEERVAGLEEAIRKLAEAQARTEAKVHELAEAQARTEAEVRQLAEAQLRIEKRVTSLEDAVRKLIEAQLRIEKRVTSLEDAVRKLIEAQLRIEKRVTSLEDAVRKLIEAQARTEVEVRQLAEVQRHMAQDMAAFKGRQLELTYQQRVGAYFGPLLRRVRALLPVDMEDDLEAHLSPEEFRDLLLLDLLVRGQPRYREGAPEVWLAVEISAVIDRHDVERALRRAGYLQRAGYRVIPTVTGERATEGADEEAEARKVLMLLDGRAISWEEALNEALS
jgi:chromosome segregation ATPase